ncbi:MAG: MFS transporter [Frankiaceae bacterium]
MGTHARHRRGRGTLWHHGDFLRLWSADTISQAGTQVSMIAIPLLAVKTLDASTFQVGLLTAAETAAFLLVGLPAGAWVDRLRRRPVMVAADWGRAALLGSIPVASALGALTMLQLYVVALLAGVLTVFFDVSYQSYLPSLVGREHLVEGNAKLQSSQSVAQVVGPGVGGWLVQALTAPIAVAVDAASYLASALGITAIRKHEPHPAPPGGRRGKLRHEISEGLRFVFGHRLLWAIAGTTATANLFSGVVSAVSVPFLVRDLHLSAGAIGALFSVSSIGGIVGAVTASAISRRVGSARTIWTALLVTAPMSALVPLAQPGWRIWLFAAGAFFLAFGAVVYNVAQVSFRQALCPERLLGRMNATMRFIVWGTMPLGGLLGGALGEAIGNRATLWVSVAGYLAAPMWAVLSPMRRMRDMPGESADEAGSTAPEPALLVP